jgi:hypothetical protein
MLVQDTVTGNLHQVPDYQMYQRPGGLELYDGLGNPVGLFPGLIQAAKGLVSNIPIVGGLVRNLLPGGPAAFPSPAAAVAQGLPAVAQALPPVAQAAAPFLPPPIGGLISSLFPGAAPPLPTPPGWIPAPVPYTGLPPRRVYMRCSTWRAPTGLVPAFAPQMPGIAPTPLVPPVPAGLTPAPGFFPRRRFGRFRRRR